MSRNFWLISILWLAGAAMASPPSAAKAASAPPKAARPNILLITLDTTRADRMGFLGSTRGLTPNLDALARQSIVFTRAYSQVPLTTASHATILTGTYPQFHKVDDFAIPLAADLPYAPDILHSQGYHTAAFVSSLILDPGAATAPGFDRGFDLYDAGFRRGAPGEDRYETIERRADVVVAHALAWLNKQTQGPYFVWVHLYDAHDPYDPPEPYKSRYASAPYDGEIAYLDSAVGKLLTRLRTRGLYDNTLIAVMADHGESLGAHGEDTHGVFLYDETIRVPLLFKLPHASAAGKRVATRVGLVDVLPTILQATGVEVPKDVQGQSLLEMTKAEPSANNAASGKTGENTPDRPAYAVSDYPQRAFGWSPLESWRSGKYLFIEAPRKELYDQTADLKAEHDLTSTSSAVSETLAGQLHAFRQKTTSDRVPHTATENPEMQEKLAALGYVSSDGTAAVRSGAKDTAADPKDKIEVANLFRQASLLMEDQRYDEAVVLLEQVIAKEPETATAYRQLGNAYMAMREFSKAAVVARKAVELRPEWAIPHYLLGTSLAASKDYAGAAPEFETVVARMPRWTQAHVSLGNTYVRTNRLPEAIKEYEKAIELDPDYYPAYLLVGRVLTATGDLPGALEKLTKAASLNPTAPEPHRFLADLYDQMGRQADAKQERTQSQRIAANAEMHVKGAPPPNIILVTLDTTRADRMGFLGSKRGLTPNLDALAQNATVFTHAYAQAPLTPVSHATILTGTYPPFHQVLGFLMPLAKDLPYAPDILRIHGYETAAFIGSLGLDAARSTPGFERGFDTYDSDFHPNDFRGPNRYQTIERRGAEVVDHALAWLKLHPKGPFFVWVHLYDPHDPYDPPEPFKTRYSSEPYDGEIAYVDSVMGKFVTQLKARGLYDGAMIAVMADHGESLGAHKEDTHGIFLYDETIQVPLVIKLPHGMGGGKRVESRVELADVLPTLLQAAELAVPGGVQGESLLGMMTAEGVEAGGEEAWRKHQAYSQSDYQHGSYGWSAMQALRTGKYLYVQAPRRELYDQTADPKTEHNLATESKAVADTLSGRIDGFRQKVSSKREAPKARVDPAAAQKLAALGYVVSSNGANAPGAQQEADPKDKIETADLIRRANFLLEEAHYQEAVPLLQELLVREPDMVMLYSKFGGCYMMLHQTDKALPMFRKAVELNPTSPTTHIALATALMQSEDFNGAAVELEKILVMAPNLADIHILLAAAYAKTNRVPETIKESQKVLELFPKELGTAITLGRFLARAGDLAGAVTQLKKASAIEPRAAEPHLALADVYDQLGQKEDAAQERTEAKRLGTQIAK